MKIVFYRHSLLTRGGDKTTVLYANFLAEQGHDVSIHTNILNTKFKISKKVQIKKILWKSKVGTILWALFVPIKVDIVIADIIVMAVFLFIRNTKSVLYFAQDYDVFYYQSSVLRKLINFFYFIGLKIFSISCLAASQTLKKELSRLVNTSHVVQNGINSDIFSSEGQKIKGQHKKPILIFARKDSRKGLDVSIEILRSLGNFDAEIWVIGEKVEDSEILMDIRNFGYVSEEEMACILRSSYLFLSSSNHEGFGLLVLESLACGCPVVVTQEVKFVEHLKMGWVFQTGSFDDAKKGIMSVFENLELRQSFVNNGLIFSKDYDLIKSCKNFEFKILNFIKERK